MGMLGDIDMGRKLWRGAWNAQPWGPLYDLQVNGVKNGTDFYFNKSQRSFSWHDASNCHTYFSVQTD